jgi:hypothetical protein
MPAGKEAGQRCIQLDDNNLCLLFGLAERPKVCAAFGAEEWVCGTTNEQAMLILSDLENLTSTPH